jgi:hypothetical protein
LRKKLFSLAGLTKLPDLTLEKGKTGHGTALREDEAFSESWDLFFNFSEDFKHNVGFLRTRSG